MKKLFKYVYVFTTPHTPFIICLDFLQFLMTFISKNGAGVDQFYIHTMMDFYICEDNMKTKSLAFCSQSISDCA
jgi:hypothetical protein